MALLIAIALTLTFWDAVETFARGHESQLKLASLLLGPIATVFGFYLGHLSKQQLVDLGAELSAKSEKIGKLDESVRAANAELAAKRLELEGAQSLLVGREDRINYQNDQIKQIAQGTTDLWRLRPAAPCPKYWEWLRAPQGAKIVCIGNNKGGVGKTMLSGNLAAFISEKLKKNVLLIDLDHQGSVSGMMLLATDNPDVESRVERLFESGASLATLSESRIHLAGKLNRGWIVPANYSFAGRESQLLFKYVIDDSTDIDLRYRLAHTLLNPQIRRDYDAIIIDLPPRLSLGSVNALFASHSFVIPTILDKLSADAVNRFVLQMMDIKKEFKLDLDLAGVVGMMTRAEKMSPTERDLWAGVCLQAAQWKEGVDFDLGTIPRRVAIANAIGDDVPYLLPGGEGETVRGLFDPVCEKICERIGLLP